MSSKGKSTPQVQAAAPHEDRPAGNTGLTLVDSQEKDIPFHSVPESLSRRSAGQPETAAQRRRRQAAPVRHDSEDDGTPRVPPTTLTARQDWGGLAQSDK